MAIEVESAVEAEKRERRQRNIMYGLLAVAVLGAGYAAYDYSQLVGRASMPKNLNAVETIIQEWKATGFVQDFDAGRAVLVVNDDEWNLRPRPERIGIITQLARYCAEQNASRTWAFRVQGSATAATLGELGPQGIRLN